MADIIPYQPVQFNGSRDDCLHGDVKPVKVNVGDVTQFQFKVYPCGDARKFTGTVESGWNWTQTGDEYCHTAGAGSLRILATLNENVSMLFQLTVTGMTAGSIGSNINWDPATGMEITENGVYTFYYTPTGTFLHQWFISVSPDFDGCIVEPTFFEISPHFKVQIVDDQDNIITTLDKDDGIMNFQRQWLTITIDWDLYVSTHDCYYLRVFDPCVNTCSQLRMKGQDFFVELEWTISTGAGRDWVILGGIAYFEATGLGQAELIQTESVCSGITYTITYTLTNMLNNTFQLNVGGTLGVLRSVNGTFTETIIAGGTGAFRIIGDSPAIASDFEVTDFTFEAIDADLQYDYESNLFAYGVHSCTKLINATNNEDAFGMGFYDTEFNPRVRVESKIFPQGYEQERQTHQDSKGKMHVVWGNNNRIERLRIINETPFLFDFLSLLPLFNHWYIGAQEYFVNEDEFPEISWSKFYNCGSIDLEIRKKTELIKQQNCTDQETSGQLGEDQVLEQESSGIPIFTTLNEKIPVKTTI